MRDLSNLHRAIERVENMLGGAGGGRAASGSEASSKQKLTEALSEYGWEAADCLAITDDIIANGFTARLTGVFEKNGFSSHWPDCHFAGALSLIPIETPTKGRGGCSRMTVSPTARLLERGLDGNGELDRGCSLRGRRVAEARHEPGRPAPATADRLRPRGAGRVFFCPPPR